MKGISEESCLPPQVGPFLALVTFDHSACVVLSLHRLFSDSGDGPFPAILDLHIFGAGLSEKRPSLLASRGFVVLTVEAGVSKNTREAHLECFEEAIEFLKKQHKVSYMIPGDTLCEGVQWMVYWCVSQGP